MPLWKRKIVLIAGVAGGALAIAALGDSIGAGQALTVAVAGLALALVIVIGGPWAFGEGRFAFQERDAMQPHEAAVIAREKVAGEAPAHGNLVVFETVEDYWFLQGGPVVFPARPADSGGPFIEGETNFVPVGNGVGHDDDDTRT